MVEAFMQLAIELSAEAIRHARGGPFGAVVVRDGAVVGQGGNAVLATNDPTAHAEIVAIRAACARLGTFRLDDCELYASCEPCPMCLAAVYWARLPRVYYAATRDDAAAIGFDDAQFYAELDRPPEARSVELRHVARPDARAVLDAWMRNPDRRLY